MNKRVVFEASAFENFNEWSKLDKKLYKKIVELIKDIDRSPFIGLGKPEPLKYELSSFWSRKIGSTVPFMVIMSKNRLKLLQDKVFTAILDGLLIFRPKYLQDKAFEAFDGYERIKGTVEPEN
jgi:toxin YoeB